MACTLHTVCTFTFVNELVCVRLTTLIPTLISFHITGNIECHIIASQTGSAQNRFTQKSIWYLFKTRDVENYYFFEQIFSTFATFLILCFFILLNFVEMWWFRWRIFHTIYSRAYLWHVISFLLKTYQFCSYFLSFLQQTLIWEFRHRKKTKLCCVNPPRFKRIW